MSKLKFIDLFAGVGGVRLGLEQAFGKENTECVLSSEIDKFAVKTYKENFNNENVEGDIFNINEKEIKDFDFLLAGFPCQPFSKAGKGLGFKDPRGTLFFEILRIIKEKRPKVVFLENVGKLKSHDNGDTFKVIKKELTDLGYELHYEILNSKDFGVPQGRKRIYIVGFLNRKNEFNFPEKTTSSMTLNNILESKVDDKYTISDKRWEGFIRRKEKNVKAGKGFGFKLLTGEEEFGPTLTARYYKDGGDLLIEQENKNPRMLTPLEAKRYQGFPESFKIPVSDSQAYKQFGNSVSVPVIKSIFEEIKKAL